MDYSIADRLAKLRRDHGYSQEGLAAELNLTRQAVSRWERGESLPDTENLIALADLYGVSLDELVRPGARVEPSEEEGTPEHDDLPLTRDQSEDAVVGGSESDDPAGPEDASPEPASPEPIAPAQEKASEVAANAPSDAASADAVLQAVRADVASATQRVEAYRQTASAGPARPEGYADAEAPEWQISPQKSSASHAGVWAARILVVVLALALAGGLATCSLLRAFSFVSAGDNNEGMPYIGPSETTIDAAEVRSLQLDWTLGTVEVVSESGLENIVVTEDYLDQSLAEWPMNIEVNSAGTLIVDDGVPSDVTLFNSKGKHLTVRIPADIAQLGKVECDIASGELAYGGVSCDKLDIQLTSGAAEVTDVVTPKLNLQVGSGEARIEGEFSDEITASVQSGDVQLVSRVVPNKTDLDVTSGNIDYRLPENAEFKLRAKSTSGDVSVGFEATNDGDTYLVGKGGSTIDVNVTSGDITIRPI